MSPPPNWSPEGRASKDPLIWHVHAPQSAFEIYRHRAWQPIAGIGHPLPLHFMHGCDHTKGSENVEMTALPLPRARRLTGRRRKANEPVL